MSKNTLHTLPLHVGDLMKETAHLTHDQFGVFMRLLLVHFNLGAAGIPRARLHHFARVSAKLWARKYTGSLEPLFETVGANLVLPRLVETLREVQARTNAQRDNALKRWHVDSATAVPAEKPNSENQNKKEEKEAFPLYEIFPSVLTAEQFFDSLPQKWLVIADSYKIEKEFLAPVAMGFWERFVGRYPGDPHLQEKFPLKKNWEKAWEFECDRLDRVCRGLPPRADLPMQKGIAVKRFWFHRVIPSERSDEGSFGARPKIPPRTAFGMTRREEILDGV